MTPTNNPTPAANPLGYNARTDEGLEALLIHRELELLRACAPRRRGSKRPPAEVIEARRERKRDRGRKLATIQAFAQRVEKRGGAS